MPFFLKAEPGMTPKNLSAIVALRMREHQLVDPDLVAVEVLVGELVVKSATASISFSRYFSPRPASRPESRSYRIESEWIPVSSKK